MNRMQFLLLIISCILLTSCAATLNYHGQLTDVVDANKAADCSYLARSKITLSTLNSFSVYDVAKKKKELTIKAQNLAGSLGANTIVYAHFDENSNSLAFKLYQCKQIN